MSQKPQNADLAATYDAMIDYYLPRRQVYMQECGTIAIDTIAQETIRHFEEEKLIKMIDVGCGAGHDMYMSIVEARDDCFAFTVYELGTPLEEVEVAVGANPDYLPTPHRHQLRTRPLRIHRQDIGIIKDKVCC